MKRIATKIKTVRDEIELQLSAEAYGLTHVGTGLLREGYVGGYLQALSDVELATRGVTNGDGRFRALWEMVNR